MKVLPGWLWLSLSLVVLLFPRWANAQNESPKLVIVVSVDQLCQEYLQRFNENVKTEGKFFALAQEKGAYFRNCYHQHAFTVTAPGHAALLTGTYPYVHGIVGNNWYDRSSGGPVYCVSDSSVENLGLADADSPESSIGMSPRNLQADTVGDVLKLVSGGKSRVFGIAWKDRAGILMAGHAADAAFWIQRGQWVTSTYYTAVLPGYMRNLNESMLKQYSKREWKLALPMRRYMSWIPDDNPYERGPNGMTIAFPHVLPSDNDDDFIPLLAVSPFANELTLQAAMEIIRAEKLGQDEWPDLLCIGLSANDYVGHAFGPQSLEAEDMTYRTDAMLAEFVGHLSKMLGPSGWTIVLTADHAVAPIPKLAAELRLPALREPIGSTKNLKAQLETHLRNQLGVEGVTEPLVLHVEPNQVYLQHGHPEMRGEKFYTAQKLVRDWLLEYSTVSFAYTRDDLMQGGEGKFKPMLQRAWHPRRSGDVLYVTTPYGVPGSSGTSHGTPWNYDTHVPLMLLGQGVRAGRFDRQVSPAAIAGTVSRLFGIEAPAASVEGPLNEALQRN